MDELLTLADAAKLLEISEKSLLRILAEEEVPARKVAGKWRFAKSALIGWIAEGKSKDYATRANLEDDDFDEESEA